VDETRIKDAQESIHDVIASFQHDMISDELLEQTKAYLIHQITTNLDKQSVYIERALRNHLYLETYDLDARMASIKNVTREDIMYVANKLKPVMIHRVRGVQS
jgi:predicted Zn-dependent peptidase